MQERRGMQPDGRSVKREVDKDGKVTKIQSDKALDKAQV